MKCADLFGILRVEHRASISISVLHINLIMRKYGVRNKKKDVLKIGAQHMY